MPEPIENITPEGSEQQPLDLGASIDQTVNPVASPQDTAIIQQAGSQFAPPPASTLSPITAVGDPGTQSLMPGLNQPINVGQTSGQIIGSHGVYVPSGQVAPWGVLMEQQKQKQVAQQQQDALANEAAKAAHLAKKAKAEAFKFERPKIPTLKDPGFQKSLNEAANGMINSYLDQAKQVHGADWDVALKSDTRIGREFQQAMDGLNVIAKNADLMTEKFAKIEAGIKNGKTYYSPEVKEAFRDYEQMMGDFEKGDFKSLANARNILRNIDGHVELNNYLKDAGILTGIKARITGSTGISDMGDFMKLKTSKRKVYDENIKNIIKNVRKSLGNDYPYSDEEIRTAVEGHLQNETSSKSSLTKKADKGGRKLSSEDINIYQGNKPIQVNYKDKEGKQETQTFLSTASQPIPTSEKPMDGIGMQFIDKNGKNILQPDVQNFDPIEAQVIQYEGADGKKYSKRVVVVKATKEVPEMEDGFPTGKKVKEESTHLVDYDSNRDRWKTELGKDFDEEFTKIEVNPDNEAVTRSGDSEGKSSSPKEGETMEVQEGTAIFRNGQWELK